MGRVYLFGHVFFVSFCGFPMTRARMANKAAGLTDKPGETFSRPRPGTRDKLRSEAGDNADPVRIRHNPECLRPRGPCFRSPRSQAGTICGPRRAIPPSRVFQTRPPLHTVLPFGGPPSLRRLTIRARCKICVARTACATDHGVPWARFV